MSDHIYNNVIRTESEVMDDERVEMTVDIYESADCVRGDDFRTQTNTHQPIQCTGSDCVKMRSSSAAAVCLGLLCVLLLTAVIALSVHIYTNSTKYTQEKNELLNKITNLTEERDQLLSNNTNLTDERHQLLTNNTNLTEERDQLLTNNTNLTDERDQLMKQREQLQQEKNDLLKHLHEMGGWMIHNSSLYFMSTKKKSWTDSRRDCTERGADLIIINNRDKQDFVKKISCHTKVWIGLTNSDEEGTWKWTDGTTMTSGFWAFTEPNGLIKKENCVVTHSSGWADYPCGDRFHWICEKSI